MHDSNDVSVMDIKHSLSPSGCDIVALRIVPYPVEREMFEKRECSMLSVLSVSVVELSLMSGCVRIEISREEFTLSEGLTSMDERLRCPDVTVNNATFWK